MPRPPSRKRVDGRDQRAERAPSEAGPYAVRDRTAALNHQKQTTKCPTPPAQAPEQDAGGAAARPASGRHRIRRGRWDRKARNIVPNSDGRSTLRCRAVRTIAGEDLLDVGALAGAVAAAHLADDYGGPDSLFGAPVGGVDRRVPQEREEGAEFAGQVRSEALSVVVRRGVVDQPAELGEQATADGSQTVVADSTGVAPIAQREGGLQGVLHVAGAVGMIREQFLTAS